jgi:hypothetical protein
LVPTAVLGGPLAFATVLGLAARRVVKEARVVAIARHQDRTGVGDDDPRTLGTAHVHVDGLGGALDLREDVVQDGEGLVRPRRVAGNICGDSLSGQSEVIGATNLPVHLGSVFEDDGWIRVAAFTG